jgi:hypothetical protein
MQRNVSIWTGNKNTSEMSDCGNWEEGIIPGPSTSVIIYGHPRPFPVLNYNLTVKSVTIEPGAKLSVSPGKTLTVN